MKKCIVALLLTMCSLTNTSAQSKPYRAMLQTLLSHSIAEVTVAQAKQAQTAGAYLLDAREQKEYSVSHIKGALLVGYDQFDLKTVAHIPKNSVIVVYCSVGYRSEKIAEKLKTAGYSRVSNLYGGIFQWVNEDNTVVDNKNKPTKKVHAFDRTWGVWLLKGEKVY